MQFELYEEKKKNTILLYNVVIGLRFILFEIHILQIKDNFL